MKKRILFVCLGNICRSPAAEGVFRSLIKKRGLEDQFHIDSAGTGGWHQGSKADKRMRDSAEKRGIYLESLARKIKLEDLYFFDLILTMDNENLAALNSLSEEAGPKLNATIQPILSYATNTDLLEVPDPYYGGQNGFDEVLDLLEDACGALLEKLILVE